MFPPEHTPQSSKIAFPHSPLSLVSSQPTGVSSAQSPTQSKLMFSPKHTPQSSKSALNSCSVFPPEQISQSSIIAVPKQSPLQSISSLFPKHIPQSSISAFPPLHTPQSS